ncbi:MAG: hypothetical protein J7J72_11700 [Bacteroidales bacterium]|nr:hypothetical protein [Bacteroidales bacterium]
MDLFSVEVLVPLGFFLFIIVLVYLGHQKKIRMALIEKGLDPDTFKQESHQHTATRIGIFMTAVGIGVLIANAIAALGWLSEDVAYISMIFIFGGVALISSGFFGKKN